VSKQTVRQHDKLSVVGVEITERIAKWNWLTRRNAVKSTGNLALECSEPFGGCVFQMPLYVVHQLQIPKAETLPVL
jgi:hypothetical protein